MENDSISTPINVFNTYGLLMQCRLRSRYLYNYSKQPG